MSGKRAFRVRLVVFVVVLALAALVAPVPAAPPAAAAGNGTIAGQILDHEGDPFPNLVVRTEDGNYSTQTESDGTYFMQVPEGIYTIVLEPLGSKLPLPDVPTSIYGYYMPVTYPSSIIVTGGNTTLVNYQLPGGGLLRVTTSPALPSIIEVDGRRLHPWGLDWMPIEAGPHIVCARPVSGFLNASPECVGVDIVHTETTTLEFTFAAAGFLQVQTSPALPATISIQGPGEAEHTPRNTWGLYTDLEAGQYSVCFGAVANFAAPPCQTVDVIGGQTTPVTGTYTAQPGAPGPGPVGHVRATTSPALPAGITVNGFEANSWGLDWLALPAGESYTVCFDDVPGYTLTGPRCFGSENVVAGQTDVVTATYRADQVVKVTTSPALPLPIAINGHIVNSWGAYTWVDLAPGEDLQVQVGQQLYPWYLGQGDDVQTVTNPAPGTFHDLTFDYNEV